MPAYSLTLSRSAEKELTVLDSNLLKRISLKLEQLTITPRPSGCVKLQGKEDLWRIRIGNYRVIYSVDDAKRVVDISLVRHRKDVYR